MRKVLRSFRELFWTHLLTAGTTALTLFLLGGFLLLQENLHGLVQGWGSSIQIFAYIDGSLTAADIAALSIRIAAYPEVEKARFVSQAEALASFKKSAGAQSGILEGVPADALPASFEIALKPAARDTAAVAAAAKRLRAERGITQVDYPEEWAENLGLVALSLEAAKWILGGFIAVAALFIVSNSIKLAILARRDEIEVMELIGAPPALIRLPFVIEGTCQGLTGAALSLALLGGFFYLAASALPQAIGISYAQPPQFLSAESCAVLLVLGTAIGAVGSLFALGPPAAMTRKTAASVLFMSLAVAAAHAAEPARELEGVRQKMQRERQGISQAQKREGSVLGSLAKIDTELDRKTRDLKRVNSLLQTILADLARKEEELRTIDTSLAARRGWINRRAAALYRSQRSAGPFVLLSGADSAAEVLQRRRYFEATLAYDRAQIARLSDESARQKALADELEEKRAAAGTQKKNLSAIQDAIRAERRKKEVLLASVRREKESHQRALKELEQAALRLQKMMDELNRRAVVAKPAPSGTAFEALRGKLDYPVRGTLASGFGAARHPEVPAEVFRKGIDIDAPLGEEVRAVEAGKVVFADRFSGYGKMMIIDHGERYYTVYAHLAELLKKAGDPVRKGEPIAQVGDSESLAGSRLYFEIRKDGKPVDPGPWFRK